MTKEIVDDREHHIFKQMISVADELQKVEEAWLVVVNTEENMENFKTDP